MSIIEWNDGLAIGVNEIDSQHREFVVRTNDFLEACEARKGHTAVLAQLDFLSAYALIHFNAEEQLMRKHRYPAYEEHRGKHVEFVRELERLRGLFQKTGSTSELVMETRQFIIEWLMRHITSDDMKIARFVS